MTVILLPLIALALAVTAWLAPRSFVGVGLIAVIFSTSLRTDWFGSTISLLDEAVVVVALVVLTAKRLVSRRAPVVPGWTIWFGGFVACGLLSSLLGNVPTALTFQAAFLAVKGVAFALGVAQVDWRSRDLRYFAVGGGAVVVVIFLASLVNLLVPEFWLSEVIGTDTDFGTQFGLPVLVGPFEHPAALGRICALLAVAAFSYRLVVGGGWYSTVVAALAAFPAVFAFRAKTLVSLAVGIVLAAATNARRIPRLALIVGAAMIAVAAVPIGIAAVTDFRAYFLTDSARSAMTFGAVDVATRLFPLGAGFGRYGSYLAGVQYSPEYVRLGFENVYGLTPAPNLGAFLNDTQWPAIVGEAGWIGGLLFLGGIIHIVVTLVRKSDDPAPLSHWLRTTALAWMAIVVTESIAAPVFTSAPAYPLPFVAAAIYWSLSRVENKSELA